MLVDDIHHFLNKNDICLNKDLGQHFLIEESVLDAILASADIQFGEKVIEIGPGIGILTKRLLKAGAYVTAIELDEKLLPLLKQYTSNSERTMNTLTVIHGNALHTSMPASPYKVVANIPYHITSPLLRHIFVESAIKPSSLTLLIQREVAERICDTHDRSLLSIIVGLFGSSHIIALVEPEAFLPPPKVDSAILQIEVFTKPKADKRTIDEVFRLTKIAFAGKRKMLSNTMKNIPHGLDALIHANIDSKRRPQTLSVDEWISLASAIISLAV